MRILCRRTRRYLDRFVDGDLGAWTVSWLQRHLERCGACRDEQGKLLALRRALRTLPAPFEPERGRERVLARFDASLVAPPIRRSRAPLGWRPAAALTIALAAAGGFFFMPRPVPQTVALPGTEELQALYARHDLHTLGADPTVHRGVSADDHAELAGEESL
jgi:anti-sigma factor RsiW